MGNLEIGIGVGVFILLFAILYIDYQHGVDYEECGRAGKAAAMEDVCSSYPEICNCPLGFGYCSVKSRVNTTMVYPILHYVGALAQNNTTN